MRTLAGYSGGYAIIALRHGMKSLLLTLLLAAPLHASLSQAEEFSLDMRDADIEEFIATIGKLTGKTIVIDPRVKGKVSIRSPQSVTSDELYEIFLVQLGVSGFAVVDVGENILKVIPQQAVKLEGIEVQGDGSTQPRSSENIVTRVVQVKNVDVAALVPILRPLVDNKTGIIAPYPASNVILITDREANVRRLLEIIVQVDKADTDDTEIIHLKNASAREVSQTLTTLIREQMKTNEGSRSLPMITADSRTNSLLIRADEPSRAYLRRIIAQLDGEVLTDNNTRVFYLKYAKAGDMVSVLESISSSIIEADKPQAQGAAPANREIIHIKAHETTNSVVMSGSPRVIRSLVQVIEQLDIRRAQVMVEAIIVEMSENRAKELGVQWLLGGRGGSVLPAAGTNFNNLSNGINGLAAAAQDSTAALAGALQPVEGMSFGIGRLDSSGFNFAVLLKALQNDTDSNILSTPSLVTMDNEEASILVGSEVPIVTGQTVGDNNSNPFQTVTRQDVGIKLRVTPQVNDGSAVQLKIEQEVSSLSGATLTDIITDKREIKTAVMVDDGATIVLGGLIDDDVQESASSVPGLGSLPLIGRLFRSDRTTIKRRNLMVFIRPTIIRDRETLTAVSSGKYGYIRARQLMDDDRSIALFPDETPALLPEWTGFGPATLSVLPPER